MLMIEPGKAPYEAELDGSLESMQKAVGGGIEGYYPYAEPVAIVCNDEGKINGLPLNRAIYNEDGEMIEIMAGTFFMAGLGEESFTDLPDYFMDQYKEQFKYPEKFYRLAGEIVAVKQPLPPEEKQQPAPVMEEPDGDDIRLDESTDLAFDLDEFFRQNSGAYADLYPDSHAEKERMADELLSGDTGKIRMRLATFEREEHMEGETEPLLKRIYSYEKEYGISAYSIYQLDLSDNTDELRFMSLDWLESKGLSVDRDHYQMVYARQREPGETLEDIYRRFNIDHLEDFRGHSLSVSDVVVLHEKGTDTAYYMDSIGFKELPGFFGAGAPEARRDISMREQLDNARKQAAQAEPKTPDKKAREPERS
ncbi:MAG: YodL domain-containing protein [Blautia producta]|nr:YodL domain-containing protein [Blautia producta]MDU5384442.1 YodL domain-containing protein [Blautia producta]MDU6885247.1 YodL domain-containing protein [Blautia producta]